MGALVQGQCGRSVAPHQFRNNPHSANLQPLCQQSQKMQTTNSSCHSNSVAFSPAAILKSAHTTRAWLIRGLCWWSKNPESGQLYRLSGDQPWPAGKAVAKRQAKVRQKLPPRILPIWFVSPASPISRRELCRGQDMVVHIEVMDWLRMWQKCSACRLPQRPQHHRHHGLSPFPCRGNLWACLQRQCP